MHKILVVEDSPMVMKVLKHVLSSSRLITCEFAESFAQAREVLAVGDFFAALVDLNLPDAPDGEVVDFCLAEGLPTVVLTGSFDERRREQLQKKGIVDYVIKEGRFSYLYALGVLERLVKNQRIKVLVVDDSDTSRNYLATLLRQHLYQVLEAKDGVQAIKLVVENPELKLLIVDYNMPRMNGCELVKHIRVTYEKSALVMIGLSSETDGALSARFIKSGANDFLRKPFNHEEFYCRVSHSVEFLELIEEIRDASARDELTGTYNSQHFYRTARQCYEDSENRTALLSLGVLELEGLRAVNESFGPHAGDRIIAAVADELAVLSERFLLARGEGKTFYLLMPGLGNDKATALLERMRQLVLAAALQVEGHAVSITFSAGTATHDASTGYAGFDSLLAGATASLRRAQEAGGDLVFGD